MNPVMSGSENSNKKKRSLRSSLIVRHNIKARCRRVRAQPNRRPAPDGSPGYEAEVSLLPAFPTAAVNDTVRALESMLWRASFDADGVLAVRLRMHHDSPATYWVPFGLNKDEWWMDISLWADYRQMFLDSAVYDHSAAARQQDCDIRALLTAAWNEARAAEDEPDQARFFWSDDGVLTIKLVL